MEPEHLRRIRSICDALVVAGFETLDKQADVLRLPAARPGISCEGITRNLGSPRTCSRGC
jgi:hypothetical protein